MAEKGGHWVKSAGGGMAFVQSGDGGALAEEGRLIAEHNKIEAMLGQTKEGPPYGLEYVGRDRRVLESRLVQIRNRRGELQNVSAVAAQRAAETRSLVASQAAEKARFASLSPAKQQAEQLAWSRANGAGMSGWQMWTATVGSGAQRGGRRRKPSGVRGE